MNKSEAIMELNDHTLSLLHIAVKNTDPDAELITASTLIRHCVLVIDENNKPLDKIDLKTAERIVQNVGFCQDVFDRTFHKTWDKVADAPIDVLIYEQIIHYFSTYGMEALTGKAKPMIPFEKAVASMVDKLPENLMIVSVLPYEQVKAQVIERLTSITKPDLLFIRHTMDMLDIYKNDLDDPLKINLDDIASFEVSAIYCGKTGITPSDPQLFLRCALYRLNGSTLIIKNNETINAIKRNIVIDSDATKDVVRMFKNADLVSLSSIFLRQKPLFLAFKQNKEIAPVINKLRRLANKNHKPLPDVTVANVMTLINNNRTSEVAAFLGTMSIANIIKLYNYALNAASDVNDVIYNIRNGKTFTTTHKDNSANAKHLVSLCNSALKNRLAGAFKDKKFFIPENINYAMPVSEKQMIGAIPYGTSVSAATDADALCVAIAWNNCPTTETTRDWGIDENGNERCDIDLHLNSATEAFGWNSRWRDEQPDEEKSVLYSGDMTDATNGATEAFRIKVDESDPYLVSANLYTDNENAEFQLFLASAEDFRKKAEGMVDISKALTYPIRVAFNGSNAVSLGYVLGKTFTFYGGSLGSNIVPKKELYKQALSAITSRCANMLSLRDFIVLGGGTFVSEPAEDVIDFSPANLTSQQFFDLLGEQ